jgi:hypothetical protein
MSSQRIMVLCVSGLFAVAAPVSGATYSDYSLWAGAAGVHTTINFEDYPDATVIAGQYGALSPVGVLFSTSTSSFLEIENRAGISAEVGGVPVSGNQVLDVDGDNTAPLTARLVVPGTSTPVGVRAAGAWMIDLATFGGGVVSFYDVNGALVDSLTFSPAMESNQFFGAVSNVGIAKIVFDGVASGEYVMIDDFVLTPEPVSALLLGLGALGLLRRRSR